MSELPTWAKELPWEKIKKAADDHNLDPNLIAAICHVESSGLQWINRHEPDYKWTIDILKHAQRCHTNVITERNNQQTSWGLMQIMGGTARWIGFEGHMPELCKPEVNLKWGCKYLERLMRGHSIEEAISCYNAGSVRYVDGELSNQPYVDKVLSLMSELEMKKPI